jgi:ribosomal protein S18 acetylase RimI-like enzyme
MVDVLADAFHDDPVMAWLIPDVRRRATALATFFAFEVEHVGLRHPSSLLVSAADDLVGAAVILPPGHWRTPLSRQVSHGPALMSVFRGTMPKVMALQTALERAHPREPHYYLPLIGVAARARGRGVGSQLLTALGKRCDEEQLPAYLEATSPNNARLYRRHGFETVQELSVSDSPPLELMLRRAAA